MAVEAGDILTVTNLARFIGTEDVQNVYTVRKLSGSEEDEADVLTDLVTLLEALMTILAPIISVLVTFDGIRAVNRTKNSDIGQADFSALTVGSSGGEATSPTNAMGVTLRTSNLSRLGRKFVGVASETSIGGSGQVAAGTITVLASYASELLEDQIAASGNVYQFGIVDSAGLNFLQFNSAAISPTVVTQRRRRQGVGS